MKQLILVSCICIFISSCNSNKSVADIWVRGNCGMCKERIETTAKNLKGVDNASWDLDSKMLHLSYDSSKITMTEINAAIAGVGHSTKLITRSEEAHASLPDCCKEGAAGH